MTKHKSFPTCRSRTGTNEGKKTNERPNQKPTSKQKQPNNQSLLWNEGQTRVFSIITQNRHQTQLGAKVRQKSLAHQNSGKLGYRNATFATFLNLPYRPNASNQASVLTDLHVHMYHWEANWYEDSRNFESPCPPSFGFLFDPRTKSEFDTVKLVELHSDIFADQAKAVLLLWIIFVSLSSLCSRVCFYSLVVTCWERDDLWLSCVLCSLVFFVTFSYGVPGQVSYLIWSIPVLFLPLLE